MALVQSAASVAEPETAMDPLVGFPEAELRQKVLMQLSGPEKRAASMVCHSWRAAVAQLPVQRLDMTTEQVAQPTFLQWLRQPGRAAQVPTLCTCDDHGDAVVLFD